MHNWNQSKSVNYEKIWIKIVVFFRSSRQLFLIRILKRLWFRVLYSEHEYFKHKKKNVACVFWV